MLDELQTSNRTTGLASGQRQNQISSVAGRFLHIGSFTLDTRGRRVQQDGKLINLPSVLFSYLATLARHAPQAVSSEDLVKEAQSLDEHHIGARNLARWRIPQLRQLLEAVPERPAFIVTARSLGYRLEVHA